jgi:glycosyltransferase involved in cell wall biosynthesis
MLPRRNNSFGFELAMVKNKRPLIIYTRDPSNWTSCQSIEAELHQAYRLAFSKNLLELSYLSHRLALECDQMAEEIFNLDPERIIFLNYRLPGALLSALSRRYGERKMPPLFLHIYGNFTLQSAAWQELTFQASKLPITLIAASKRHQALLRKILPSQRISIQLCPFPVATEQFFFSDGDRQSQREEWSISSNDIVLCYAGRLTLQKNIDLLLRSFSRLCQSSPDSLRLVLCGPFDDCGFPQAGLLPGRGSAFFLHQHLLNSLPTEVQERILIVDRVDRSHLRKIFCAADIFVSLSTHHDEDFGIAPAEAISTGTYSVLSDWGGFADFLQKKELEAIPVPTLLALRGVEISKASVDQALGKAIRLCRPQEDMTSQKRARQTRHQQMEQWLSAASVAKVLQKLHRRRISSVYRSSARLDHLVAAMRKRNLFDQSRYSRHLYHSIYRSYVSRTCKRFSGTEIIFENWKSQYFRLKRMVQVPQQHRPESTTRDCSWPLSMKSLNPLNPLFLDQIVDSRQLFLSPTWFVRDGRKGIQSFFQKFPSPPRRLTSQIFLPEMEALKVPRAWHPLIAKYQIQPLSLHKLDKEKNLLVIWSPQHSTESQKQCAFFLKVLEKQKFKAFFFLEAEFSDVQFRLPPYFRSHKTAGHFQKMTWPQFLGTESFQGYDVLDLTSGENCADSFLKYLVVSRGGRILSETQPSFSAGAQFMRLSPYHGLHLSNVRNEIWDQLKQMGVATD